MSSDVEDLAEQTVAESGRAVDLRNSRNEAFACTVSRLRQDGSPTAIDWPAGGVRVSRGACHQEVTNTQLLAEGVHKIKRIGQGPYVAATAGGIDGSADHPGARQALGGRPPKGLDPRSAP